MKNKIIGIAKNAINTKAHPYPILFCKPWSSLLTQYNENNNRNYIYLKETINTVYEFELALIISKEINKPILKENFLDYIGGYCLALDLTEKTISPFIRKDGSSLFLSKGIDHFTPISDFISLDSIKNPMDITLELHINDKLLQKGNVDSFGYSIPEQLTFISYYTSLNPGDIILTGTFSSNDNDQVKLGDKIYGKAINKVNNKIVSELNFTVANEILKVRDNKIKL